MLYARVSQARNDTRSVPDQLAELRTWATRDGWTIVAEHSDEISASKYANGEARPGWSQVTDVIATGGADVLAVWEISRATRDRSVFAALLAACSEASVLVATGGRLHDPNDPDDGFLLDLTAALATRESSVTSKRVRRAAESRAATGRPHAGLPYGYRRVCDTQTGVTLRWEPHPDQAPIVAEIFKRLLSREPANAIAADLNNRGISTGGAGRCAKNCGCRAGNHGRPNPKWEGEHARVSGRWIGGNLSKLALNPTYAALRARNGRVLDGVRANWPPIITEAQHYGLVALYGDSYRDKWRSPKTIKHLGGGLYRCGRDGCDGRMRVVTEVSKGRPNRYDCRTCHKVSRLQAPVDEFVSAVLVARLSQPDVLAALSSTDDADVATAQIEVARLQGKLAQARQLVDEDRLSLESLADLETRTLPRLRVAQQAARPRNVPAVVAEVAGEQAAQRWAATPIASRRAVLDALITVTILPTTRRFQSFDPGSICIDWR
ncbi:MAG: site-specific recombinase [Microbacteriaceae bacterium]|nr:site-specific recombinase [Microbacteriaceae bacterium]